jgi:hypothetical protein
VVQTSVRLNKQSLFAMLGGTSLVLACLHLLAVGGVGLWVWGTAADERWGTTACKAETVAVIFSHNYSGTRCPPSLCFFFLNLTSF